MTDLFLRTTADGDVVEENRWLRGELKRAKQDIAELRDLVREQAQALLELKGQGLLDEPAMTTLDRSVLAQ